MIEDRKLFVIGIAYAIGLWLIGIPFQESVGWAICIVVGTIWFTSIVLPSAVAAAFTVLLSVFDKWAARKAEEIRRAARGEN